MKVIELCENFGIHHLQVVEKSKLTPAVGEVLVKLEAVSLNYVDLLVVEGKLNPNLPLPYTPVCDGAGVVEQVGEGVIEFKVGDRVATTFIPNWRSGRPTSETTAYATRQGLGNIPGQLMEYKIFQENQLIHHPTHLSAAEAATLPIAGLTAWNALRYGILQTTDVVLLYGTGGVSIFALQLAKAYGAQVIITSSSDAKLERAQQLGVDFTINYKTNLNWEASVMEFTNGKGVDLVVETVGGQNLQRSINSLRMGGHISVVGLLDGFEMCINTLALMQKQITLKGMEVGGASDFDTMNKVLTANKIHPIIDKIFAFDDTQAAFEYLDKGLHFGKVVITI